MPANAPIELTDADWAATPRPVWLAMMDVRRERDNEAAARARLQQDYDAVRVALQQTHAQGAIVPANATADDNGSSAPEEKIEVARAEVTVLEQKLLEVRQEKEDFVELSKANLKDALHEQQERMRVDAESREREMATRLEQAEASARETAEKLAHATQVVEESRRRLEAERDEARAERDAAVTLASVKEEELVTLRAELLAAKNLASAHAAVSVPAPAPVNDIAVQKLVQPPEPEPESVQLLDEDMDPNWLTPVPETPAATPKPDTAGDQTEVIDLSMDSDDETIALISPTRTKEIVVKSEPKASPAPSASRNASPGPGPSTSRNRAKHAKRSAEDIEDVEPPKSAKRTKKSSHAGAVPSFDYGPTRKLLDTVPPSLNQRIANLYHSIEPRHIPADKLATRDDPTIGWVKRALFVREYKAHGMFLNTYLDIQPSLLLDHEPATDTMVEQTVKHPALFLGLDMNPGLPIHPGNPGTIISNRTDIPLGEPVLLVVASLNATCKYVGRYMCRRDQRAITKQEWQSMHQRTRKEWANTLSGKKEAYLPVGLQLALSVRRKGNVTDAEVQRVISQYKVASDKDKAKMRPTKEEVLEGLDKGYGTVGVITLEPLSVGERLYEEIWDKHLAGDCYDKKKVGGKQPGDNAVLKAPPKIISKKSSSSARRAPNPAASASVSPPGGAAGTSDLRRSSRPPKRRRLAVTNMDSDDPDVEDEPQDDSGSDFDGAED